MAQQSRASVLLWGRKGEVGASVWQRPTTPRRGTTLWFSVLSMTKGGWLKCSMEVPQKWKTELPYDPVIALRDIYPKDIKMLIRRGTYTPMFITVVSKITKLWKEPKCPSTDEWIKKMWYIYNGISVSHQKEWNFAICNNVDGTRVYYAKWNKSVKERQIPYDFTHMCSLRNETNEQRGKKRERQMKKHF